MAPLIHDIFTHAEAVYAAGIITTDEHSDSSTFLRLLGNLKHVRGSQLHRMILQAIILFVTYALTAVATFRESNPFHPNFSEIATMSRFGLVLAPPAIAVFYELFAPSLADGNVSLIPATLVWICAQVCQILYLVGLMAAGFLHARLNHQGALFFLATTVCAVEILVSEAWISKAKYESAEFKVPCWAEVETILALPRDTDEEISEIDL